MGKAGHLNVSLELLYAEILSKLRNSEKIFPWFGDEAKIRKLFGWPADVEYPRNGVTGYVVDKDDISNCSRGLSKIIKNSSDASSWKEFMEEFQRRASSETYEAVCLLANSGKSEFVRYQRGQNLVLDYFKLVWTSRMGFNQVLNSLLVELGKMPAQICVQKEIPFPAPKNSRFTVREICCCFGELARAMFGDDILDPEAEFVPATWERFFSAICSAAWDRSNKRYKSLEAKKTKVKEALDKHKAAASAALTVADDTKFLSEFNKWAKLKKDFIDIVNEFKLGGDDSILAENLLETEVLFSVSVVRIKQGDIKQEDDDKVNMEGVPVAGSSLDAPASGHDLGSQGVVQEDLKQEEEEDDDEVKMEELSSAGPPQSRESGTVS